MSARKLDLNTLASQDGVKTEFSIKAPEEADEKSLRLRKEFISFVVKDVGLYVATALFILAMSIYCLWMLGRSDLAATDREWARQCLTAILGGMIGMVFGKAASK